VVIGLLGRDSGTTSITLSQSCKAAAYQSPMTSPQVLADRFAAVWGTLSG
jgi:hypothetical protein